MITYKGFYSKDGASWYEIPIESNWSIKKDWNKLDYFTFNSNYSLQAGYHISFYKNTPSKETLLFSGQIMKKGVSKHELYSYETVSYGLVLRSKYTKTFTKKSITYILKWIKSKTPTLTWNIGNIKTIINEIIFKEKTLLEMLSTIVYECYRRGILVDFYIQGKTVTFKPLPSTVKGYVIDSAYNYNYDFSVENLTTGYTITKNGKVVKVFRDTYLTALYGDILENYETNDKNVSPPTTKEIKSIVKNLAKQLNWLKLNNSSQSWSVGYLNGGVTNNQMQDHIANYLKMCNINGKLVQYKKSGKTHRSILYLIGNKYYRFPYTSQKMAVGFRDSAKALSKSGVIVIKKW